MDNMKHVGGVGKGSLTAEFTAINHGMTNEGIRLSYETLALEEEGSNISGIYGMAPMAKRSTFLGTRRGTLSMVPDGHEDEIIWPSGTKHIQVVFSKSGHLMLPITSWKGKPTTTTAEVFSVTDTTPTRGGNAPMSAPHTNINGMSDDAKTAFVPPAPRDKLRPTFVLWAFRHAQEGKSQIRHQEWCRPPVSISDKLHLG